MVGSESVIEAMKSGRTRYSRYPLDPVPGERFSGVYRRNVLLPSGRFALLVDGMGFSLLGGLTKSTCVDLDETAEPGNRAPRECERCGLSLHGTAAITAIPHRTSHRSW
jgi:hypothetical protein